MEARRPCPDSALLAAFIDGTLGDYERTAVVSHLGDCRQCRAVALTVVEFREVVASDQQWHEPVRLAPAPLTETRVRRWSREKTRAPALALAAAAAIAALAIPLVYLLPRWSANQAVATLVDAAEGQRPLEARIAGGFAHAATSTSTQAYEPRTRGWQLISAAGRIREKYEADYTVPSRRAAGVAALLLGDLDDAVSSLSIASSAAPNDSRAATDLAAAYYERALRGSRVDDLPAALSAVERAIALDPSLAEAWFNRALIISALRLRAEAQSAWQMYLERDPTSPWADEARERLQALVPIPKSDWLTLRQRLTAGESVAAAELAVREHASRARDFFDSVLLTAWVAATTDAGRQEVLDRMRVLADAFAQHTGERFYADLTASLRRISSSGPVQRDQAVAAHREFLAAMALITTNNYRDALPALKRVHAALAGHETPLRLRVAIEVATSLNQEGHAAEAVKALLPLKREAIRQRHRVLQIRAAWIHGLSEFARNDLSAARLAYEEMLEASVTANDGETYVMANVLLGNLHWMFGDLSRSWQYRLDAMSRLDDVITQATRSNVFISAAGDALSQRHDAAVLLFQSALLSHGPIGNSTFEVQARTQRALSLHRLGRDEASQRELERARQLLSTVATPLLRERVEADLLVAESELVEMRDNNRAVAAARAALSIPGIRKDLLRQARFNLRLADALKRGGQFAAAETAVHSGIDALEAFREASTSDVAIGRSDSAWSLYETGAELALRRGDIALAFDFGERRRMRTGFEWQAWRHRILPLEQVQRGLDTSTAIVVLNQLDDRLHVWVIRNNAVTTHAASMTKQHAAGVVAAHLNEIARGSGSPEMSGDLYDALLRPVSRALHNVGTVAIIADAPYDRVAFAGLWDRRANRFIVEDHGIVSVPNAAAFAFATERSTRPKPAHIRQASIVEAPNFRRSELESVSTSLAAIYGAPHLMRGEAATSAAVLDGVLARDVLHVSAPVVASGEYPAFSRLVMADQPGQKHSGSVFARQIGQGTARARLVALAPQQSRSGDSGAAGSPGVARALLAAGVPTVVGPVVDTGTAELDRTWLDFHRQHAAGTAVAESLRRAQVMALDESKRRTGPWATLTVFGSTQ